MDEMRHADFLRELAFVSMASVEEALMALKDEDLRGLMRFLMRAERDETGTTFAEVVLGVCAEVASRRFLAMGGVQG